MKLSKLNQKVIVNTINGEMLGYISDLEIDMNTYEVKHFVVEERQGLFARLIPFFFKSKSIQIDVNNIQNVGSDVVLIEWDKIK